MLDTVSTDSKLSAALAMRSAIAKVATGPEYSKDLSFDEAKAAMDFVLSADNDPVQTAVFFIGLRMKRETDDENKGILQSIKDTAITAQANVDELVDIADPYDGHARGLPMSAFIAPVLAANGIPAVCHGLDYVGPKYGITQHNVLKAAGVKVDLTPAEAAQQIENSHYGWAYVDQAAFAPRLHDLVPFRTRIIKRQVLTTVEVLVKPITARNKTHLLTGYVHKAYPPIYAELARFSGYDSAMIVRGVEGGVIPSLQQPGKLWSYHDLGKETAVELDPTTLGFEANTRAVPLTKDIPELENQGASIIKPFDTEIAAQRAAEAGLAALNGEKGPAYNSLVYAASITLHHLGKADSLTAAADMVRKTLDSGKALAHLQGKA
ncbi:MAG: anthranilate phosphoribosyltransferase [Gammaproteobacteria bacterium]|nr:anthranilate phosphoribosyltransferase [Gammaproteobacteria bacterium]